MDDAPLLALFGGEPAAGQLHLHHRIHRHRFAKQRVHARKERNAQIHFGEAKKSPAGLHQSEVKSAGHDGSAGESVTVDGGHGDQRVGHKPQKQPVELIEKSLGRVHVRTLDDRHQPFQVDAV